MVENVVSMWTRISAAAYVFWRVLTDPVPEPPGFHWHKSMTNLSEFGVGRSEFIESLKLIRAWRRVRVVRLQKLFGKVQTINLMSLMEILGLIERTAGRWAVNLPKVDKYLLCRRHESRQCHNDDSYFNVYGVHRTDVLDALALISSQHRVCTKLLRRRFGLVRGADILNLLEAMGFVYQYTPPRWVAKLREIDKCLKGHLPLASAGAQDRRHG